MSTVSKQITTQTSGIPKIAIGVLVGILTFGMFVVGYDQGHLFSLAEGQKAFDTKWMHEFYHDMRHAAGFPCH
ncbi:MAG: CbtB domain-containing protein [Nitrososphaeraceae archaeon]